MIPAGANNELMGLLFVDSILMLCSDYTTQQLLKTPLKDPDLIKLRQTKHYLEGSNSALSDVPASL
jgi:hypothetical protein